MAMLATARLFYSTTIKLCKYENLNHSYVDFDCIGYYYSDNGRGRNGYDSLLVFRQIVGNIVLPLVFGVVMSIVVAALKKDDKPED